MSNGHYRMHRGWMNHPKFAGEPYSRAQAWCWLIENACWTDTKKKIGGKMIILKRGQLSCSTRVLAEQFGWSHKKLRYFFDDLASDGMIATDGGTGLTVISICNYEYYQSGDKGRGTAGAQQGHSRGTAGAQQRGTEENDVNSEYETEIKIDEEVGGTEKLTQPRHDLFDLGHEESKKKERKNLPLSFPDGNDISPAPKKKRSRADLARRREQRARAMMDDWNRICAPPLPKAMKPTPKRIKLLNQIWAEDFERDRERWREFCREVAASDWLSQRIKSWPCSIDWCIDPDYFTKIVEGQYHNDRFKRTNGAGRHDDTTSDELKSPYGQAVLEWNRGGKEGPRPKKEDYPDA